MKNYTYSSHRHCFDNPQNPCGIPLEKHTQCCLCDLKAPNPQEDLENWRDTFLNMYQRDDNSIMDFISNLLSSNTERVARQTREEVKKEIINKIDKYFEGLILIPKPQATKEKLIKYLIK